MGGKIIGNCAIAFLDVYAIDLFDMSKATICFPDPNLFSKNFFTAEDSFLLLLFFCGR